VTSGNTLHVIPTGNQLTSTITKNVNTKSASVSALENPTTTD
jgi:hypothetical protein